MSARRDPGGAIVRPGLEVGAPRVNRPRVLRPETVRHGVALLAIVRVRTDREIARRLVIDRDGNTGLAEIHPDQSVQTVRA